MLLCGNFFLFYLSLFCFHTDEVSNSRVGNYSSTPLTSNLFMIASLQLYDGGTRSYMCSSWDQLIWHSRWMKHIFIYYVFIYITIINEPLILSGAKITLNLVFSTYKDISGPAFIYYQYTYYVTPKISKRSRRKNCFIKTFHNLCQQQGMSVSRSVCRKYR